MRTFLVFGFGLLVLTATSVNAQSLPRYELLPVSAQKLGPNAWALEYRAVGVDRVRNKIITCQANIKLANRTLVGRCVDADPVNEPDLKEATIVLAVDFGQPDPQPSANLALWTVDQSNGEVTLCVQFLYLLCYAVPTAP